MRYYPRVKVTTAYARDDYLVLQNSVRMIRQDLAKGVISYDGMVSILRYIKKLRKTDRRLGVAQRTLESAMKMWWDWLRSHIGVAPKFDPDGQRMIKERNALLKQAADLLEESLGLRPNSLQ